MAPLRPLDQKITLLYDLYNSSWGNFMELNNVFSIDSGVCSIKALVSQKSSAIEMVQYIAPVYQRPYEWDEEQIEKFINGLFQSFWGQDKKSKPEPLFYGTIQLSIINKNSYEIIDGQQRLTTILLILLVLRAIVSESKELKKIDFSWLKTKVNKGKEQEYLNEVLELGMSISTLKIDKRKKEPNLYKKNAIFIKNIIINIFDSYCDDVDEPLDINFLKNNFVEYFLCNIHFVVLKTKASLSKTVQIYNAINTSGLPLDEKDVFKVKIYEYLRNKKNCDDTVFDEINDLYRYVEDENEKGNKTSIDEILDIYKCILIARYNLPQSLYNYATDTFFDQLFDTISNIKSWNLFDKNIVNKIDLSLEEIKNLIDAIYKWYNISNKFAETVCANNFIWSYTRYSNFWFLPVIFLYKFSGDETKMIDFNIMLNKLYIIYSIWYYKPVKAIKEFSYTLIRLMMKGDFNRLMDELKEKINETNDYYNDLKEGLMGNILSNKRFGRMICCLSAMLHEDYLTNNKSKISDIEEKLFGHDIDIEHIQPVEDKTGNRIDNIWVTWGEENINSLGNLMVLESRINRQIKDKPYSDKVVKYKTSQFAIVKDQKKYYEDWNLENCKKRKEYEVENIIKYLLK